MSLWVIILIVLSKSNHIITDEIDADYQLSDEFEYEVWNIEAKNVCIVELIATMFISLVLKILSILTALHSVRISYVYFQTTHNNTV